MNVWEYMFSGIGIGMAGFIVVLLVSGVAVEYVYWRNEKKNRQAEKTD